MMKRTNVMVMGKRGGAIAIAAMMALLGFSTAAKADLPDPHVFLDYSTLDFVFTRTAATNVVGSAVGTFSINDTHGSTLDAILRDSTATEVDRATILSSLDFDVSVSGSVVFNGSGSYSLAGSFVGTDDTGTSRILADFQSTTVALSPVSFSKLFTVAGALSSPGGSGSILAAGSATDWSFFGHSGDTVAARDIGGDDTIAIVGRNIASYDSGALVDFTLGVDFATLESLFSADNVIGGGDMKVTIVPAPTALLLGMIGFGTVGWFRRRMS